MMACKYCEGGENLFERGAEHACFNYRKELWVSLYAYDWVSAIIAVNFCPMCGRDLRGDDQ